MGWYGIEWIIPIYGVVALLTPILGIIIFRRRIKRGATSKPRAFAYFMALTIAPPVLYALFFLTLVGLQDLTYASLITEGLARSVLPLTVLGIGVWLLSAIIFTLILIFTRTPVPSIHEKPTMRDQ